MMNPNLGIVVAVWLTACASPLIAPGNAPAAFRVTAFRQGLMVVSPNKESLIYDQGNKFPYAVNGTCVANGESHPCMWHGFEISFESPDELSVLECFTESSRPTKQTTPGAVIASRTSVSRWGFQLDGLKGHYVRPQYTFAVGSAVGREPLKAVSHCYFKGQEVLTFEMTIFYPPVETSDFQPE